MGLKFVGPSPEQVAAEVRLIAKKKVARAREAWTKGVNDILQKSIDNSPVDKHNLEDAHQLKITETTKKLSARIEVGGTVGGRNVDQYAWVVHDGLYRLGKGSLAKAASGKAVGRKFLDRAVDEMVPKLIEAVNKAVEND